MAKKRRGGGRLSSHYILPEGCCLLKVNILDQITSVCVQIIFDEWKLYFSRIRWDKTKKLIKNFVPKGLSHGKRGLSVWTLEIQELSIAKK